MKIYISNIDTQTVIHDTESFAMVDAMIIMMISWE